MHGVHIPRTRWHHIGSSFDSGTMIPQGGSGMSVGGSIAKAAINPAVGGAILGSGPIGWGIAGVALAGGFAYDYIQQKKEEARLRREMAIKKQIGDDADALEADMRDRAHQQSKFGAESQVNQGEYEKTHNRYHALAAGGEERRSSGTLGFGPGSLRGATGGLGRAAGSHGNVAGAPSNLGQKIWAVTRRVAPLALSGFYPAVGNAVNVGTSLLGGNLLGAAMSAPAALGAIQKGNFFQKGILNDKGGWRDFAASHLNFDPTSSAGRWNIVGKLGMMAPILASWKTDTKYQYPTMGQSGGYY